MVVRALFKCLLNTDRLGPSTLLQESCPRVYSQSTLSVKKCLLMSHLNLSLCSSERFSHVPSLDSGDPLQGEDNSLDQVKKNIRKCKTCTNQPWRNNTMFRYLDHIPALLPCQIKLREQSRAPQLNIQILSQSSYLKRMIHKRISVERLETYCYLNLIIKQDGLFNIFYKRANKQRPQPSLPLVNI